MFAIGLREIIVLYSGLGFVALIVLAAIEPQLDYVNNHKN